MTLPIVGQAPSAHLDLDPDRRGWPLLRLGFRPFYLLAALFAALAVPAWLAMRAGAWRAPAVPALAWHAHEMLFGFAVAVIVGFLFTAGRAWTGQETPRGAALGAIAALWVAGRVAPFVAPPVVWAAIDLAFLPVAAAVFARVLWKARNRRQAPLVALLLALAACNAVFHLGGTRWLAALHGALAAVVTIECVIAGRVVPSFTANATPGLRIITPAWLPRAAIAGTVAGLAAWVMLPANAVTAAVLLAAAGLHVALARAWRPGVTAQRPILWILHASYACIPLGLALLAAAQLGWLADSPGVHALAVGATGGLVIGMVTRTARGHTGRPLAVSRLEVAAYGLVLAAAALRSVLAPVIDPSYALPVAAAAWSTAFALYAGRYGPWLCAPRADGRDG